MLSSPQTVSVFVQISVLFTKMSTGRTRYYITDSQKNIKPLIKHDRECSILMVGEVQMLLTCCLCTGVSQK